jgi:hypothetical protein
MRYFFFWVLVPYWLRRLLGKLAVVPNADETTETDRI